MIDFSGLISQLLSTYWWLLPLFVIAALFKPAWFKGFIGEVMFFFLVIDKQLNNLYLTPSCSRIFYA